MIENPNKKPRIPFHPAYGYATPEQIAELESMGLCPQRDYLLQKIERQTKRKGVQDD